MNKLEKMLEFWTEFKLPKSKEGLTEIIQLIILK
jgi:hypothetical protein